MSNLFEHEACVQCLAASMILTTKLEVHSTLPLNDVRRPRSKLFSVVALASGAAPLGGGGGALMMIIPLPHYVNFATTFFFQVGRKHLSESLPPPPLPCCSIEAFCHPYPNTLAPPLVGMHVPCDINLWSACIPLSPFISHDSSLNQWLRHFLHRICKFFSRKESH